MAIQLMLQMMLILLIIREAYAQAGSLARPGCQQTCGSITIPYPFGIGTNCSADETFEINCNNSRPFLSSNNLQVLEISLEAGMIRANNPVITANCENRTNGLDVNLLGPFTFSDTQNRFTAMGCDNLALITRQDLNIGGCMSFCNITSRENSCFGINCCQTRIPPSLKFINASLRSIDPNNDQKSCKYAFIVDQNWFFNLTNPYSVQSMEQVPVVLDWRTYRNCSTFGSFPSTNASLCGNNAFCSNQSLCSCLQGYEGNPYLPDGCRGKILQISKYQILHIPANTKTFQYFSLLY